MQVQWSFEGCENNIKNYCRSYWRKKQTSDDLLAALPLLSRDINSDRKNSFFATLRPLLSFLESRARNELKVFEWEDVLTPGQIEPAELVDKVVLLSWEKFAEKPDNLSLEFWLLRLLLII